MSDAFSTPEGQRKFLENCLAALQHDISELQQLKAQLLKAGQQPPDDNPELLRVIGAIRELKKTVDGFIRDLDDQNEGKTQ